MRKESFHLKDDLRYFNNALVVILVTLLCKKIKRTVSFSSIPSLRKDVEVEPELFQFVI